MTYRNEHTVTTSPDVTPVGRTLQTYLRHQALAIAWVRYNSRSGRASAAQTIRVQRQLSISDLERMLGERGIEVR